MEAILAALASIAAQPTSDLAALRTQIVSLFQSTYSPDTEPTPEQVEVLRGLSEARAAVDAELAARTARTAEAASFAAGMVDLAVEEPEEEPAEDAPEEEAPAEEPETIVVPAAEVEVVTEEATVVTAAAPIRVRPREIAANADTFVRATAREVHGAAIVASGGEIGGFATGQTVEDGFAGLSRLMQARLHSMPSMGMGDMSLGQVRIPYSSALRVTDDQSVEAGMAALDAAVSEANLPGGSLVAAGGWCAPSETVYDLCSLETTDGIFSLPSINAARGGLRYVRNGGPVFADIYANPNAGWEVTEAQDSGDPYEVTRVDGSTQATKPCVKVPCVEFDECRLTAYGFCVTSGLLAARAYPEVLQRYIEGVTIAHAHRRSARQLAAIRAGGTAVSIPAPSHSDAASIVLSSIELQIEDFRHRNRSSRSQSLEAVMPFWLRGVIRADLSRRLGLAEFMVSDEMINGWFRLRGANPQWVITQDGFDGRTSIGGATPAIAWPDEVEILLYAAGAWVSADQDVLTLGLTYDRTQLDVNDQTNIWTEDAECIIPRCDARQTRVITIPICPSGTTAGGVAVTCSTITSVTPPVVAPPTP